MAVDAICTGYRGRKIDLFGTGGGDVEILPGRIAAHVGKLRHREIAEGYADVLNLTPGSDSATGVGVRMLLDGVDLKYDYPIPVGGRAEPGVPDASGTPGSALPPTGIG